MIRIREVSVILVQGGGNLGGREIFLGKPILGATKISRPARGAAKFQRGLKHFYWNFIGQFLGLQKILDSILGPKKVRGYEIFRPLRAVMKLPCV